MAVPRLEIRANQQRQFGLSLELIVQDCRGISLALHDTQWRSMRNVNEATDVEVRHIVHDLLVGRGVRSRQTSVISGEEKLTNFSSTDILRSVVSTQAFAAGDNFFGRLFAETTSSWRRVFLPKCCGSGCARCRP